MIELADYQVKEELVSGVYEAEKDDKLYVLKKQGGPNTREILAAKDFLGLEGAAQYEGIVEVDGQVWLSLEHVGEVDLEEIVDTMRATQGNVELDVMLTLVTPIAKTIQGMNERGWVYNDLCGRNVRVGMDVEIDLVDYGECWPVEIEKPPEGIGIKLGYGSPQQMMRKNSMGNDVYGIGALAYRIITGKTPVEVPENATPKEVLFSMLKGRISKINTGNKNIDELIAGTLEFSEVNRPTMEEVVQVLEKASETN